MHSQTLIPEPATEETSKEPQWQSGRFKATLAGLIVNLLIVILAERLGVEPEVLVALILGNTGLTANYVHSRTKRNTAT